MRSTTLSIAAAAAAFLASISSAEAVGRSLPHLSCPTYVTTDEANDACASANGTLMTWGTCNSSSLMIESALGDEDDDPAALGAEVGPYRCTACDDGKAGFGYIGVEGESIPSKVSIYTSSTMYVLGRDEDDYVGVCPDVRGSGANISCAALQRTCEENGFGWLIYAETFDTGWGAYMCAGCDGGGANVYGTEDDETDFTSWPMLMMYGMIAVVLATALYVDARVFVEGRKGQDRFDFESGTDVPQSEPPEARGAGNSLTMRERRSWYLLYLMGYADFDGQKVPFCKAVCLGRFKDLYCCKNRMEFGKYISMLLVTFGVAALFRDGELVDYNCYFDATKAVNNTYQRQFIGDFYGQENAQEKGDTLVYIVATDEFAFWLAEALVVGYQFSIDLLTHGLAEGGYMKRGHALLLMIMLSAFFCAGAMAHEWERMDGSRLYRQWFLGFIVALFMLGPVFSTISYLVAMTLVKTNCLSLPSHAQNKGPLEVEGNEIQPPLPVVPGELEAEPVVVQGAQMVVQGAPVVVQGAPVVVQGTPLAQ